MTNSSTTGVTGHQDISDGGSSHNSERLHIASAQDERRHVVIVRVLKTYGGGVDAAPTVDVQPLINQVDGLGSPTNHAPIYGLPVSRVHSGSGAIISDPMAGDDYVMSVADRDISKYLASGQQSSPDSKRRGSLSDGILHHAVRSPKPTQYLFFKPAGGFVVADSAGNEVETFPDTKMMTLTVPTGGILALGGDPAKGGTFGFVMTDQGTSTVVKAKL